MRWGETLSNRCSKSQVFRFKFQAGLPSYSYSARRAVLVLDHPPNSQPSHANPSLGVRVRVRPSPNPPHPVWHLESGDWELLIRLVKTLAPPEPAPFAAVAIVVVKTLFPSSVLPVTSVVNRREASPQRTQRTFHNHESDGNNAPGGEVGRLGYCDRK